MILTTKVCYLFLPLAFIIKGLYQCIDKNMLIHQCLQNIESIYISK